MFKRKLKDVYTFEDRRLDEKSEAIFNTRYRLKEVAKEVYQSQQVIMILPDGADKVAEIEYCSKLQYSLLAAIGAYDIARQDFNDYVNFVGEAHQMAKALKPRDRIRLGNVSCTNWYNKEKDKKYYTFTVFSYEFVSSYDSGSGAAQQPAATSQSAAQSVADDDPF